MKRIHIAGIMLIALVLAFALAGVSPVTAQDDDLVERGEYIAIVGGCRDCHTPLTETGELVLSEAFSGGRPFDLGPLGVVLTSNLTSDEETGLGAWTDEEIEVAIRTGVAPDGRQAFPVMPYIAYNGMSDDDMAALIAYLRSLEPFERPIPREQIAPVETLPQLPMPDSVPSPDADDQAARGWLSSQQCDGLHGLPHTFRS